MPVGQALDQAGSAEESSLGCLGNEDGAKDDLCQHVQDAVEHHLQMTRRTGQKAKEQSEAGPILKFSAAPMRECQHGAAQWKLVLRQPSQKPQEDLK